MVQQMQAGPVQVPATGAAAQDSPRSERRFDSLRAAWPAWLIGHLLVIALSCLNNRRHPLGALFKWDTIWYRDIAQSGYGTGGLIHFFPLTSACAALVHLVTRIPVSVALFGFCWAAALAFGALLHRLVLFETGDRDAARRAAWLIQLAPGGYALVMGYTEPLAGLLAVGYFFALRIASVQGHGLRREGLRRHALWIAALVGYFSGMARPTGIVLAVAGAVEGWRIARGSGRRFATTAKAALAAAAPALGLFSYLAYSRVEYHSWLKPLDQQLVKTNRGAVLNSPVTSIRMWFGLGGPVAHGYDVGAMCVVLILLSLVLIVAAARRLPLSYTAWLLPMFVLAITSQSFTSLPRYVGAIFPLIIVVALLAKKRRYEYAAYFVSAALLLWTTQVVFSMWLIA